MSARSIAKLDRSLERVRDMHICQPWVHRLSSPGFDDTHAGISTWTCPTCEPMVGALLDAEYGSHDTAEQRVPS